MSNVANRAKFIKILLLHIYLNLHLQVYPKFNLVLLYNVWIFKVKQKIYFDIKNLLFLHVCSNIYRRKEDMMEKIVDLLLEKGFFHKETYEKYGILTSEQIQRVWFEATTRRKIDFSQLPYLLETKKKKGMQKEELNAENANIFKTQEEVSQENADISRQTKLKETKLNSEEEEINDASIEIPGYAYNLATHNIAGLMESLDNHKVTDPKEKQTILRLSDYGRKGTQVWKLLSNTTWSKIGAPGKYIIAALAGGRK